MWERVTKLGEKVPNRWNELPSRGNELEKMILVVQLVSHLGVRFVRKAPKLAECCKMV